MKTGVFCLLLALLPYAGAVDVLIGGRTRLGDMLAQRLQSQGMTVKTVDRVTADDLPACRLVILPPGVRCSDKIAALLKNSRAALLLMDRENLAGVLPTKVTSTPLVTWGKTPSRLAGNRNAVFSQEKDGFIEVRTPYFRDGSVFLEVKDVSLKPGESGLMFQVSGGADSDLLSIQLTDDCGRQFVSYFPLERQRKTAFLRFADFLVLPPDAPANNEFSHQERPGKLYVSDGQITAEKIRSVAIGLSRRHLWWDKGGAFRVGTICSFRSALQDERRSGYAGRFAVPYTTIGVAVPDETFNPADGAERVSGRVKDINLPWFDKMPDPPVKYGREAADRAFLPAVRSAAERRIPLLTDAQGNVAAMMTLPADGQNKKSPVAFFGLPEDAYFRHPVFLNEVCRAAAGLIDSPQILNVLPCLRNQQLSVRVLVGNPGKSAVKGVVTVRLAGLPEAAGEITLQPGSAREICLSLPEIPEAFSMKDFTWVVRLQTTHGNDVWKDRVSAADTAEYLAGHLLQLAETHVDGRFSHHFFADIYGARALAVLGLRLNRPEWVQAARRMIHGLVSRQTPEGALPMGYGEQKKISWVADNGTAVIAILDFAALFPDLRAQYLAGARRFYRWRESFYMDDARVEKLQNEFGKDFAHIRKGFYGIGYNDGPFYGGGPKWDTVQRVERGSAWVNGISMISLPLYWQMTGDREILNIARRNLQEYLAGVPQINFFSAESLFHMYWRLPDGGKRELAARALREKYLPGLFVSKHDYALLDKGGRRTLDTLPVLYCLYSGLERSPGLRAYLVRNLWFTCSPSLPYSVQRIGGYYRHSTHGASIAAARYAGSMTLIWLAELLYPGATLSSPDGK